MLYLLCLNIYLFDIWYVSGFSLGPCEYILLSDIFLCYFISPVRILFVRNSPLLLLDYFRQLDNLTRRIWNNSTMMYVNVWSRTKWSWLVIHKFVIKQMYLFISSACHTCTLFMVSELKSNSFKFAFARFVS